jgi:hypothetical protein
MLTSKLTPALLPLLLLVHAASCTVEVTGGDGTPTGQPTSPIVDRGDIVTSWEQPGDDNLLELGTALRDSDLIEEIAGALNDTLRLPRNLTITHRDCGEPNATYSSQDREISMCWELLESVSSTLYDSTASDEENGEAVVGAWLSVMFHELGHALIDQYELPVTGKEEDAVDDFSTVLLIEAGLANYAVSAAEYWALTDDGMYSQLAYADEHSLNPQRFYGILCTVYGSDPARYRGLVEQGFLPETRAARCPDEYAQKSKAWSKLLEPYLK